MLVFCVLSCAAPWHGEVFYRIFPRAGRVYLSLAMSCRLQPHPTHSEKRDDFVIRYTVQEDADRVQKKRVKRIGEDSRKHLSTVGNHFPRWETISQAGKPLSTVRFPPCLTSRHPPIGEAASGRLHKGGAAFGRPSFVDIPMDWCLEASQAGHPTIENNCPLGNGLTPWKIVSHHGK